MFSALVFYFTLLGAVCDQWDDVENRGMVDDFIPELYLRYRKALDNSDENTITFRRVLKNNKEYRIHINKLKDVNGLKRHNLIIKEKSDDDPLIYISNPVETKVPYAYLTLEAFKDVLTGRVLRQRKEFKNRLHQTANIKSRATKIVKWITTKRNKAVYFTKPKEKPITTKRSKKDTKIIWVKRKITNNDNRTTTIEVPVVKILEKSNNTSAFVYTAVVSSLPSTRTLESSSKANIFPIEHLTLRTKTKEPIESMKAVKTTTTNVTVTNNTFKIPKEVQNYTVFEETVLKVNENSKLDKDNTEEWMSDKFSPTEVATENSTTVENITEKSTIEGFTTANTTFEYSTKIILNTYDNITKDFESEEIRNKSLLEESISNTTEVSKEENTMTSKNKPTTEESITTEVHATEESTTEMPPTTTKTTTKSKRSTLARPLVYMGGWENGK